jgi:hypothetical protein
MLGFIASQRFGSCRGEASLSVRDGSGSMADGGGVRVALMLVAAAGWG